ncbi:hypothetical protein K438DRAFT_1625693 [Mycena galopus ATCC 62051]|nr:hypothetical protein K438DRAFT_1625693 [Mycena galopus ATCC 62051]
MEAKREGAAFIGAKRLPNGGVVFDCKDEVMARWLKGGDVMWQFLGKLGATCVYRPRRVELIAEMLPVEARIDESGMWRVVEGDSGLADGAIVSARWVKAPGRRALGQRVAHAKVEFTDAEAANHAIDNGMYFQGKHIRVRKSEEEAKRCVKCQKFDGHLASACTSAVDVCGRCAGNHRTGDCPVTESGAMKCANCKVDGHGAAERGCPYFQEAQQKRRERDPTAGYRYIPTSDPKTWLTTAVAAQAPPRLMRQENGQGRGRLAGGAWAGGGRGGE